MIDEVDRQADAPLEDEVQPAEIGARPEPSRRAEAELAVEHVVDRVEDAAGPVAEVEVDPDTLGELVEALEAWLRVELLAALARDEQRAQREVDLRLRARDEAGEPGAVGGSCRVEAGHGGDRTAVTATAPETTRSGPTIRCASLRNPTGQVGYRRARDQPLDDR